MTAAGAGGFSQDDVRVSDDERNRAISALSEHLTAGRLTLDEFGTRSSEVNAARTVGELRRQFTDLPGPVPVGDLAVRPRAASLSSAPAAPPAVAPAQTKGQKLAVAIASGSGLLAVILFFLLMDVWSQAWLVFLAIPVVWFIAGAVTGQDPRDLRRNRR